MGNPPYIRQEWLAPYKAYWQATFKTFDGVADIFTYFFELGLNMLRYGGRLAFITSGSWVRGNYGSALRQFIAEKTAVESMVDFGEFQPFEEAEMIRPSITILAKGKPRGNMRLFKWLVAGRPPENLSEIIEAAPTMRTDHLGADAWELEPDNVIELRKKLAARGAPLTSYVNGQILYGVKTGLNDVFVIDGDLRYKLILQDERSRDIIKPFIQGTNLRPWYVEKTDEFLIFARRGIRIENYPAVLNYLQSHRESLEPKPEGWPRNRKWLGRKAGAYKWYELQDTVDYWEGFEQPKIVWPDISKLPRFSMDTENRYLGNTGYVIPGGDYFLLGVLSSWATWFISKTAQPLRLRGNRWQYRLIAQFMENVPIPSASEQDKKLIGNLAKRACSLGRNRYELQTNVKHRLRTTFGESANGEPMGKLNEKAQSWWQITPNQLGAALKTSFKLASNPMLNPHTADEWEPYLAEKRSQVEQLSRELADAESEINDRVYRLFNLTADEITLLQKEVEH